MSDQRANDRREDDGLFQVDIVSLVRRYARSVVSLAVLVGLFVAGVVGAYNWLAPTRWTAGVGFRPTFEGADEGNYPNGLPFSANDVVDPSIVDQVFDANQFQTYCDRDDFRSALYVQQTSASLRFLDLDYSSRLADTRLTPMQRDQIEAEYRAKRKALPIEFQLVFVRPLTCKPVPSALIFKALNDVLATWAKDADTKRNVLKLRVAVPTPAAFASAADGSPSGLIRANAMREALVRAIARVEEIERLPGAELARYGKDSVTFAEVRNQLQDLLTLQLQPLVALAGRNMSPNAVPWIQEMLNAAKIQAEQSQASVQSLSAALVAYSGGPVPSGPGATAVKAGTGVSDVQSLTPQIDQTFIDRIVALSATNTTFRQSITTQMVNASRLAVADQANVDYYSKLLQSFQAGGQISAADADRQMEQIVQKGKALIAELDGLYDEFSLVSLRSAGELYQVTTPPDVRQARILTVRQFVVVVASAMLVALVVGLFAAFLHDRLRRIV